MNDNSSLRHELELEARRLSVASTSIELIIESARRRRRRHGFATAGGVLALTAVTAVGIQQLSRVDDVSTPLESPDTVLPVVTAPATSPPVVVTRQQEVTADLAGAVPAALSAPVMTWTVIDAAGPEALALQYGGAHQRYALVTEPSLQPDRRRALYEQRDGEWVRVAGDVLPDGLGQATVSGDAIYAVGTAPATVGEAPGSVGRYDITTEAWTLTPLPAEARPYRNDAVSGSTEMSITAIADGALVVINRWGSVVDYRAVTSALGGEEPAFEWRWVDGELEVPVDCDQAAIDKKMTALGQRNESEIDVAAVYRQAIADYCTVRNLSPDELGLSAADQAELERPPGTWAFRYDGQELTPVALPDPAAQSARLYRNVLTTSSAEAQKTWFVHDDGSFEPVFEGLGTLAGASPRAYGGVLSAGVNGVIATGAPGGESTLVDVSQVVVDDLMLNPSIWVNSVASNSAATVAAVSIDYQRAGSITEPTTIEGAAYDLVIDPEQGVTVIDRVSGRRLAGGYSLVTEPGALKLVAGDDLSFANTTTTVPGQTVTTTIDVGPPETVPVGTIPSADGDTGDVLDSFDVDWSTLAPWSHAHQVRIASSVDGRSYAVESFADLVGVAEGELAEASQVDIVDGRFLVFGWVSDAAGNNRQVVLIGTPNA
jgi:hypothetical protein